MFSPLTAWFAKDIDIDVIDRWQDNGGKLGQKSTAYFLFVDDPSQVESYNIITSEDPKDQGISVVDFKWIIVCLEKLEVVDCTDYIVDKEDTILNYQEKYKENLLKYEEERRQAERNNINVDLDIDMSDGGGGGYNSVYDNDRATAISLQQEEIDNAMYIDNTNYNDSINVISPISHKKKSSLAYNNTSPYKPLLNHHQKKKVSKENVYKDQRIYSLQDVFDDTTTTNNNTNLTHTLKPYIDLNVNQFNIKKKYIPNINSNFDNNNYNKPVPPPRNNYNININNNNNNNNNSSYPTTRRSALELTKSPNYLQCYSDFSKEKEKIASENKQVKKLTKIALENKQTKITNYMYKDNGIYEKYSKNWVPEGLSNGVGDIDSMVNDNNRKLDQQEREFIQKRSEKENGDKAMVVDDDDDSFLSVNFQSKSSFVNNNKLKSNSTNNNNNKKEEDVIDLGD